MSYEYDSDREPVGLKRLRIDRGASFSATILWQTANGQPKDLTGYTGAMSVKTDYANSAVAVGLDTTNGDMVMGGNAGTITLTMSPTLTEYLSVDPTKSSSFPPMQTYVYDVLVADEGGFVTKVMFGEADVFDSVTAWPPA